MTREAIPRFDLYGELEVDRLASVAVIETAYRSLVKRHHPDVASTGDERVKRLNVAREWLTDPAKRRRYDAATSRGRQVTSRPTVDGGSAERSTEKSFGPNADAVRHFLAELRGLDRQRALQVWDGRAVAHAKGYTRARRAAVAAGKSQREGEWLFAREAASVIARGKLGDSTLTEHVLDVVADVAGAIAIRDLIPKADYQVLVQPWTWRAQRVVADTIPRARPLRRAEAPAAAAAGAIAANSQQSAPVAATTERAASEPTAGPAVITRKPEQPAPSAWAAPPAVPAPSPAAAAPLPPSESPPPATPVWKPVPAAVLAQPRLVPEPMVPRVGRPPAPGPASGVAPRVLRPVTSRSLPSRPVIVAVVVLVAVAAVLAVSLRPASEQEVAGVTDAPAPTGGLIGSLPVIPPLVSPSSSAGVPTQSGQPTPGPGASAVVGPTARPTQHVGPTPTPANTAGPTPSGAPTPPPIPTPTAPPTPTPEPLCTVVSLLNVNSSNAQLTWSAAGFSGTVTFATPVPPQYKILWQSLVPGSSVACTSGIVVDNHAP